jgi:hypothetical protein
VSFHYLGLRLKVALGIKYEIVQQNSLGVRVLTNHRKFVLPSYLIFQARIYHNIFRGAGMLFFDGQAKRPRTYPAMAKSNIGRKRNSGYFYAVLG